MNFGNGSSARFMEISLANVSEFQRRLNAEQTKNRMRARLSSGRWVFRAPEGYEYQRSPGEGKVLVRAEPAASAIQEALEGFASGRLERQAEVARFLAGHPGFRSGKVTDERANQILTNVIYAGYIEHKDWGISLREGRHGGLISFTVFKKIQERLNGNGNTPKRPNLAADFPLRGYVVCDACERRLTAYWAKGASRLHPYYH
ncbi:hypothetical protein [Falsiroseomonas sp.]|uniref:hypothetical protein n=1 Tax=Falsiroseomonas sp. TaxID=2870721 RepID=UPI003F6EAD21